MSLVVTLIVSPPLAPTWNVIVPAEPPVPSSSLMPLNAVLFWMSVISDDSCLTSATTAALSWVSRVPLSYCTLRSRTRSSME